MLAFAISANLALLGYYKYANFFVHIAGSVTGNPMNMERIVLPLGISFFTFTQIAFLVDAYRGYAKEYNPIHYGLFVILLPAPHRRPHPAPQGDDAAVRKRGPIV